MTFIALVDKKLLSFIAQLSLFLRRYNEEFLYIKVWFTDQNSSPLVIKHRKNLTTIT